MEMSNLRYFYYEMFLTKGLQLFYLSPSFFFFSNETKNFQMKVAICKKKNWNWKNASH